MTASEQAQEKLRAAARYIQTRATGDPDDDCPALDRILGYSELVKQVEEWREGNRRLQAAYDALKAEDAKEYGELLQQREELVGALTFACSAIRAVTAWALKNRKVLKRFTLADKMKSLNDAGAALLQAEAALQRAGGGK